MPATICGEIGTRLAQGGRASPAPPDVRKYEKRLPDVPGDLHPILLAAVNRSRHGSAVWFIEWWTGPWGIWAGASVLLGRRQ